jgi:hypothetical protein
MTVGPNKAAVGSGIQIRKTIFLIRLKIISASAVSDIGIVFGAAAETTNNNNPDTATQDQVWVEKLALPIPAALAIEKTSHGSASCAIMAGIRASRCASSKAGQSAKTSDAEMRTKVDSLNSAITRQAPANAIDFANKRSTASESEGAQKVREPRAVKTQTKGSLGPK